VDSVQFFQNDNLLGVSYAEPYSFTWNNIGGGQYSLTAVAVDDNGNSGTSDPVVVNVVGQTGLYKPTADVLEFYPNPVSDELQLIMNDNFQGNRYFILYSSTGNAILKGSFSGSEYVLDFSSFPEGVYVITVSGEEGNIIRKIIKAQGR